MTTNVMDNSGSSSSPSPNLILEFVEKRLGLENQLGTLSKSDLAIVSENIRKLIGEATVTSASSSETQMSEITERKPYPAISNPNILNTRTLPRKIYRKNYCRNGKDCKRRDCIYAHSDEELGTVVKIITSTTFGDGSESKPSKSKICRYHISNPDGCKKINSTPPCRFAHSVDEFEVQVCKHNENCTYKRCRRLHPNESKSEIYDKLFRMQVDYVANREADREIRSTNIKNLGPIIPSDLSTKSVTFRSVPFTRVDLPYKSKDFSEEPILSSCGCDNTGDLQCDCESEDGEGDSEEDVVLDDYVANREIRSSIKPRLIPVESKDLERVSRSASIERVNGENPILSAKLSTSLVLSSCGCDNTGDLQCDCEPDLDENGHLVMNDDIKARVERHNNTINSNGVSRVSYDSREFKTIVPFAKKIDWANYDPSTRSFSLCKYADKCNNDLCNRAHSSFELASKSELFYRVEMCKFGIKCNRSTCTRAHRKEELRPIYCMYNGLCKHDDCILFHPARAKKPLTVKEVEELLKKQMSGRVSTTGSGPPRNSNLKPWTAKH